MGFVERLRDSIDVLIRGRDPRAVNAKNSVVAIGIGPTTRPPVDAGPVGEIERQNPAIFRLVQTIASDCASVPLRLTRNISGGKEHEIITDHEALDLFKNPNPIEPSYLFWETFYSDLLVHGNTYHYLGPLDRGRPEVCIRIPPPQIEVIPDPIKVIGKYVWHEPSGTEESYAVEQILHCKTRSLDTPFLGEPPLGRLRQAVILEREMNDWNWNRFKNQIPTNLILKSEQTVAGGPDRRDQLARAIRNRMAGSQHAGEPLILDGERWDVDIIGRPSEEEIAYLAGLKYLRSTYAMTFGVPPSQMSDWSDSFRSNSKEQTRDYWAETIMGWHRLVLCYLNDIFLRRFWPLDPNLEFRYDYSVVRALAFSEAEKANVAEVLVRSAIIQPEEARVAMGYDETGLEEMKKFYWQGRELGEEVTPNAPPGTNEPIDGDQPGSKDPEDEKDNKERAAREIRQLADEQTFLILDENTLFDEQEEIEVARKRFAPVIKFIVLGAALNWLRLNNKQEKFNRESPEFLDFVNVQTNGLSRLITETTLNEIRDVIRVANSEALSVAEVRRRIKRSFVLRMTSPSLDRVATTEAHYATQGGGWLAMKADPTVTLKRWVTERDERVRGEQTGETRADHVSMEDQVVPIEAKFVDPVSGARLRFPGDREGAVSGADVINCRCDAMDGSDAGIDRTELWLKRNALRGDHERAFKGELRRHLAQMEKRIVARLNQLAHREAG